MSWIAQYSSSEIAEMITNCCAAYNAGEIDESDLRQQLARLGLNATDIYEMEKQHRPKPPEDDNDY